MAGANVLIIILNISFLITNCVSAHNYEPSCPPKPSSCPKDTLKFGVCGDWLGIVHEVVGTKPSRKCCALVEGLADVEAAVCLCTALKANVLGALQLNNIPIALSLVLNSCGKKVPPGFVCS